MKTHVRKILFGLSLFAGTMASAQVVLTNSFEEWTGGKPVGWNGSTTNLHADSIHQITEGTIYGNSAVQLRNTESGHRRFSSAAVAVEAGKEYTLTLYTKGEGDIRAGLYEGDYAYGPYSRVESADWDVTTLKMVATSTTADAQFILSVRNTVADAGHIQIDSISISAAEALATSVYDIQYTTEAGGDSPLKDQMVFTGGIVSGIITSLGNSNGYFIQSGSGPWSGIFVYDRDRVTEIAVGDSVIFTATVAEFNNSTQLTSVQGWQKISSGNALVAAEVPSSAVATEQYEGVLVKVLGGVAGQPNQFNEWTLNDGSGAVTIDDVIYAYTPITGETYNVTGVVNYAFGSFKLLPRFAEDIEQISGIESNLLSGVNVYPNPAIDVLNIDLGTELNGNATITLTDVTGKLVYSSVKPAAGVVTISTDRIAPGVYNLQLSKGTHTSTTKVVVK